VYFLAHLGDSQLKMRGAPFWLAPRIIAWLCSKARFFVWWAVGSRRYGGDNGVLRT